MFNTKAIKATILFTAVCMFGWIAHGVQTLAQLEITNEVYTAAQTDAKIVELAPAPGNYAIVSNRAMMAIQGVEYVYGVDVAITNYPNGVGFDFRNGIMFDFSEGGSGIPYYAYLRPERGYYNTAFSWLLPISEDYDGLDDILLASQEDIAVAANSATNYTDAAMSSKQDALPYPTNAIPYSVLTNIPTIRSDMITDGTNTLSANLDYEYEKVLTNTWVVNGIPYTTTTGYTYCSYFPPNPNENDMGYTLTLNEGSSWEFGYYDLSIGAWYWRNQGTEEDPDYQWVSDSGGMTGLLPANGTSFAIEGFVGTYPIKRMETSKLALTNDIPPAVQVVTPSTNAVKGTAADAKATGTALYTGFTEWEFSGNVSPGMTYTVDITEYEGPVYIASLFGSDETSETTSETVGVDSLDVVRILFVNTGITATRHLVTPTRTSQIKNDGDGTNMFATTNQIPDTMLKIVYEGDGDIFSEWAIYGLIESVHVTNGPTYSQGESYYFLNTDDGLMWVSQLCWENESTLFFHPSHSGDEPPYTLTAKRKPKVGYVFGDQTDKVLAATNSIPLVVSPSTNAENGTAADAKATGIALYTGYTTWEPYGENPGYKLISVEYNSGSWKVVYIVDGDSTVYTNTTSGAGDETDLTFHSELNSITRHLVTPTKTSQLINDSSFVTTNNSGTIETSIGIYGSLKNGTNVVATGIFSHAEGGSTTAEGSYSHSEGNGTYARGLASHSEGLFTRATERASHSSGACALATNSWSFVWSGLERSPYYGSHGVSSFNVNPINGINGFYIGEQTLQQAIVASIMDTSVSNDIEVVYQNQDNSDAAMISDIVVTQAVTNHVPTIRTAVRDVVDNAIGNMMVNVTNHYSDWFFTGLPSGVTVTSLQYDNNEWHITLSNGDHQAMHGSGENSTSLLFLSSDWMEGTGTGDVTADRFFQLQDRSMNILTTWGLTVPLSFPKPVQNKFREFRLRLVITAQPSSADYLNLHGAITNGVEETISFETEDGTFPSVTTISTNLYHFVETAPSIFYVEKKQLTPAPLF